MFVLLNFNFGVFDMFQSKLKMAISSVLCGSFFLFSPVSNAAQNDGLVAHWSFDDCTAKDVSGNGHDGTINGNPVCVDGKKGKAFKLNGVNDWIIIDNSEDFPEIEISISYWLQQNNMPAPLSNYISKELAFQSYLLNDATFQSGLWKGSAGQWSGYSSNEKYILGNWTLYTWTFSNTTKKSKTFINGKLVNETNEMDENAYLRTSSNPMFIGKNGSANVYHVDGLIDDVRLYNRALSETEIKALYSDVPGINGNINGVQKFSAVCKNLKTGVSKKIALTDGAKPWDCTAAGLKAKKGEQVNVSITGMAK